MTVYEATYPAGSDHRDVVSVALANLPAAPDIGPQLMDPNVVFVIYDNATLTDQQLATWQAAVAATAPDPNAPWRLNDTRRTTLQAAIPVLRTWAQTARSTTVSSGNVVAVTQAVVNNLGTFYDHFADLLQLLVS